MLQTPDCIAAAVICFNYYFKRNGFNKENKFI